MLLVQFLALPTRTSDVFNNILDFLSLSSHTLKHCCSGSTGYILLCNIAVDERPNADVGNRTKRRLNYFFAFTILYAVIGTLGNLLILSVYISKRRTLSQQHILALAVVDGIVCLFVMPYRIVYELKKIQDDTLCRLMEILSHATVIFSNLLLCVICIERFIKVWQPWKLITARFYLSVILIVLGFSLVVSFPVSTIFMVTSINNTNEISSAEFCQESTETVGFVGMAIYVYFMLILNFVVLGILVVLYCLIYYRLYQNRKKMLNAVQPISVLRNQPSNTESTETGTHNNPQSSSMETCKDKNKMPKPTYHENKHDKKGVDVKKSVQGKVEPEKINKRKNIRTMTWTMLFKCTSVYVVCWIPFFIDVFGLTNSLSLRYFFFFSHASNPIVYGIVNSRERQSLKHLIWTRVCMK